MSERIERIKNAVEKQQGCRAKHIESLRVQEKWIDEIAWDGVVETLDLLNHLGNAQRVTLFYAAVAIFGLGNSVLVPFLLQRLGIRLTVAAAGFFITTAAILLGSESLFGIAFGLLVRVLGTAFIEIPLIAYIMDRIPRDRFGAFEYQPWPHGGVPDEQTRDEETRDLREHPPATGQRLGE